MSGSQALQPGEVWDGWTMEEVELVPPIADWSKLGKWDCSIGVSRRPTPGADYKQVTSYSYVLYSYCVKK